MTDTDTMARSERILVVEDDEFSQQLIELYLRKAGFNELTVAADGRQALDIAKQQTFDLVLLDLNLPRISGAEVLRRLKKEGMLTDIPVIVSSSIANMDDIVMCMDLGAEDFLPKPFNVRLLEGRVAACLEKKRLKDETLAALRRRDRDRAAARLAQGALSCVALRTGGDDQPLAAAGMIIPGTEPGGDLFDVFQLADGSAVLITGGIASAAGAEGGGAAALAMAGAHALVRHAVDRIQAEGGHVEPHAVLAWANREWCRLGADGGRPPIALLVATLSPQGGELAVASAGHGDPLLLGPRFGVTTLACDRGRPLGSHVDAVYGATRRVLDQGDTLVAFGRGLLDAADEAGALYGEQRLKARLDDSVDVAPGQLVAVIDADLRRFQGKAASACDIAVVALRRASISAS